MPTVKHHKLVATLPAVLEANSIYFVRAAGGVDIYTTNSTGTIVAHRHNQGEARVWEGAADYDAMNVEGIWIVDQVMANAPAAYATPGAIVEVRKVDANRFVQKLDVIYHNAHLSRMRLDWGAGHFWSAWGYAPTVSDWTTITSYLQGWTPLAGANNRFRLTAQSMQIQLYANIGTRTAGTVFWSVPLLFRPTYTLPFQARGDLTGTAGQWTGNLSGTIEPNGDVKIGPAIGSTTARFALDIIYPLG
ncbi:MULTISPECIES: hypothetical protein [unclassified Pseudomonas]|uniref:hypothetical protein n=1 Tax=unclassified Pseudomonas TaxID=196821 RepID=UPI00244709EA|nr:MULTISPECIES: hypothetical protein [unclassified Pseudomonas]MDG9928395.1 hypothetical protein [Pseudomonas sp. GD04042]MDH0482565.1 hypothetical protein [Pseudomonas sp. GD04015]MDH0604733.1 hypothetical protein [Pseudomonas sp. GD03869]